MDTRDLAAYGLDGAKNAIKETSDGIIDLGRKMKEDARMLALTTERFSEQQKKYFKNIESLEREIEIVKDNLKAYAHFQNLYSTRGKTVNPVNKIDTEKLYKIRDLNTGKIYRLVKYSLRSASTNDFYSCTPHEYYGTVVDISFLDEDNTEFNISYTTCDGKKAKFELLDENENRLGDI